MKLTLNGSPRDYHGDGQALLIDYLREDCSLKGTRLGCGKNQCGTCHVLIDGASLPACDTPMWSLAGKAVQTIEGLQTDRLGQALTQALIDEQAGQCGYCLSGIAASAVAMLRSGARLTDSSVREGLDKHLCRCGAHNRIVRAVLRAQRALALA